MVVCEMMATATVAVAVISPFVDTMHSCPCPSDDKNTTVLFDSILSFFCSTSSSQWTG